MNIIKGGMTPWFRDHMTDHALCGAASPVPATYYIGVASNAVDPSGRPAEPTAFGYARVAVANAAGARVRDGATGRLKTAAPIVFNSGAQLAMDWFPAGMPIRSLFLADAAVGGNICYWYDVPQGAWQSATAGSPAPNVPTGNLSDI